MKPWQMGLIGCLLAIFAVAGDTLLLSVMWLRNSYWTYALLGPAVLLTVVGLLRKRNAATWTFAVVALLAGAAYTAVRHIPTPSDPPLVKQGDTFPEFTLPDQDGKLVSLASLRSQGPVVVVLFRGSW